MINICSDFSGICMSGHLSLPVVDVRAWSNSLLSAHNGSYFQSTIMFTLWSVAVWAGFCQPPLSPTSPQCFFNKSRISEVKHFFFWWQICVIAGTLAIPYPCVSFPSSPFALALLLVLETQTTSIPVPGATHVDCALFRINVISPAILFNRFTI